MERSLFARANTWNELLSTLADAMVTEKLAECIRKFNADSHHLEDSARSEIAATSHQGLAALPTVTDNTSHSPSSWFSREQTACMIKTNFAPKEDRKP
jgi:hypothetical protein